MGRAMGHYWLENMRAGPDITRDDRPVVNEITRRVATSGYGFQTLVREVVRSPPFQSRRAEAVNTVVAAK